MADKWNKFRDYPAGEKVEHHGHEWRTRRPVNNELIEPSVGNEQFWEKLDSVTPKVEEKK